MIETIEKTPQNNLTAKDFASSQEIRWCPGCGDYSILKQMQTVLPGMGIDKKDMVFVSGIGCSSRFPYYMDTYGMHSIHGRAPGIASGLKAVRPDLHVWLITGDGDALSIGGNHIAHLLRRNFDINVMMFNNEIYGLTKGQYSPTSPENKITKSTPRGSLDRPFNPLAFALGAEASFIARSIDRSPKHLQEMMLASHAHKGTSFLEIYQNCNIFNDKAFDGFTNKESKEDYTLFVEQGQPLIFGQNKEKGIILDGYKPKIVSLTDGAYSKEDLWIHDKADIYKAQILVRFFDDPSIEGNMPRVFGVIYQTERPTYETLLENQVAQSYKEQGIGDLNKLIAGNETWTID